MVVAAKWSTSLLPSDPGLIKAERALNLVAIF